MLTGAGGLTAAVFDHLAEHDHAGAGQDHHAQQLSDVGDDGRVLQRGGGVGTQEAAAVGADVLDDLQRGHGAHGDILLSPLNGGHRHVGIEILGDALPDQEHAADDGKRNQNAGGHLDQISIEVAHVVLALASQSADKGDAGGVASGGGHEHHVSDDQHLAEIRQAGLTGVVL